MSVFAPNEHNDECLNCVSLKCYRTCSDTYVMPSSRFHARSVVFDQIVGVTDDVIQVEIADVTFPVLTTTNELYVIDTTNCQTGSTLLVCTSLRAFLSKWFFTIICDISLCVYPLVVTSVSPRQLLLLLQRSTPRDIRVLLNKASSATVYTVLM